MAEANPENRHPARELAHGLGGVIEGLRVAGTIREKNAVRLESQHLLRARLGRHHDDAAAAVHQPPQNVLFDSVIECDHAEGLGRAFCGLKPAEGA